MIKLKEGSKKTVNKVIHALFGLDSIRIKNQEELTKLIVILELILNDKIKCLFPKDGSTKYPLNIALSKYSSSLYIHNGEGTNILDSLIKLPLEDLLEIRDIYNKFKTPRSKINSLEIEDNITTVILNDDNPDFSRGTATCQSGDSYDLVVGFAIAYTKASFGMDYNELQQLIKILKK